MSWDGQDGTGGTGGYGSPPGGAGAPAAGGTGGYGSPPGGYGAPAAPGGPAGYGGYGPPGGYGGPGGFIPPPPSSPPLPPADPVRAAAVALLNLSGLGIGYALMRRWLGTAICLVATGVLLLLALPADPDGVSGGVLAAYAVFLVLAAAHGAVRGLRTRLSWPPLAPVAVVIGLVLLAVPAGGVALYGNARDDATQKMLLDRLAAADQKVTDAKGKDFTAAQPGLRSALSGYRDLKDHHAGSKAAKLLPDRMKTYYATVAAPYDQQEYCGAITPLKYLRTVPASYGKDGLGSLATWPDDRLATSLYECGVNGLDGGGQSSTGGDQNDLIELLSTFPQSAQAAKVEPAVGARLTKVSKGIGGSDPCGATDQVRALGSFASDLVLKAADGPATALGDDAERADGYVESGTYACGVHQYRSGDFDSALDTMNGFTGKYPHDKHHALAGKFAIAAEIAQNDASAGKHVPTLASGGSLKLIVSNDSPDRVEILYTGKVTGKFTLPACAGCTDYTSESSARGSACQNSSRHYPKKTVYLPPGTIYLLHKPTGGSTATANSDSENLQSGSYYTDCAYTVQSFGGL